MIPTLIIAGLKYGPGLVAAVYSFLAHRQGKENHAAIVAQTSVARDAKVP